VVDAQQDTYTEAEVKQAAHGFMEDFGKMGLMHKEFVDGVKILENYLAPIDFTCGDEAVKKGTWLLGVRVHDDGIWKRAKTGDLTGFSIGGSAIRKPVA
jgi:DNA adenine methylase